MPIFKKSLMLQRIANEGRMEAVTPDIMAILDDLDNQPASTQCWARVVNDEPVLWVVGKSGQGLLVNEKDCV